MYVVIKIISITSSKEGPEEMLVANNNSVRIEGTGTVKLAVGDETVVLKRVIYIPKMCTSLLGPSYH